MVKLKMSYTDDPIADFARYDAEQEEQLEKMPVCCECDNPIQDEYCYEINGEVICETCLDRFFRKSVEDYVS